VGGDRPSAREGREGSGAMLKAWPAALRPEKCQAGFTSAGSPGQAQGGLQPGRTTARLGLPRPNTASHGQPRPVTATLSQLGPSGYFPHGRDYPNPHPSPLTPHHSPLTTHHSPLTTHHSPLTTQPVPSP